ncbi:Stomatin-like protein 2, mitochondrial [Folsomia candida]|uniref:Stomatin-like protein 2, mitochondrial n=1 Tax=Folsomia candida TaxID=158441 RepID=A0A226EW13_FOLCA|nr:Stomatin-like protein 2, mitochondrial [Folsomia candida]
MNRTIALVRLAQRCHGQVVGISSAPAPSLPRFLKSSIVPFLPPIRYKSSTPLNTVILFVPQQEAWVIERMGKFHRILEPGLNFLIPILDRIKYVNSLKEIAIDIPKQSAITKDNVTLTLDGVLYLKIIDPYKASYGITDPEFAITQLAQTTMRSELGKIALDTIFRERESLNISIVESINKAAESWGIACLRYEIRDLKLPSKVQEAMQMQVEAERKKRAQILESEGARESAINIAEGRKKSQILASEAEMQEKINYAKARAKSIEKIGSALEKSSGHDAGSLIVAEQYVAAFQNLAKKTNTLLLPSDVANVPSMVSQAMSIYKTLASPTNTNSADSSKTDDMEEYFSDDDDLKRIRDGHRDNISTEGSSKRDSQFT